MSETTKIRVVDIDAKKSVQSISDLKREIKDLKGQLVGLEQGTEEYNKVLSECAEKTHQLKEIQEQVAKSSQDFGDRMSNVRGVISGMAGAVGAVTGALALMGVEADKDSKLMKTMVAAMSITSGIQAIDAGVKSFKALTVSIKAAAAASNGLKLSLGPIALALSVVAAAAYSVYNAFSDVKKEAEDAIKSEEDRLKKLRKQLEDTKEVLDRFNSSYGYQEEALKTLGEAWDEYGSKSAGALREGMNESLHEADVLKAQMDKQMELDKANYEFSEERKADLAEWARLMTDYYQQQIIWAHKSNKTTEEVNIIYENAKNELADLIKSVKTLNNEINKGQETASKKAENDAAAAAQKAASAAQKAQQERLKKIKDAYNLENAVAKIALNNREIDEEEYHKRLYDNLVEYNKKVKKAAKQTAGELKAMELAEQEAALKVQQSIVDRIEKEQALRRPSVNVTRSTAGDSNAASDYNTAATVSALEYLKEYQEANAYQRLKIEKDYNEALEKMENEYALKSLQRKANAVREEMEILEQNKGINLDNLQLEYDKEKELMDERLSRGLISRQDYDLQLYSMDAQLKEDRLAIEAEYVDASASLNEELTEIELEQANKRIEISKNENDKKKELTKSYISAASSALSMTSQLLGALQSSLDTSTEKGFEQNKKYEIANATISYLQGLISAWSSAMELGPIAGPIAGGVLSAMLTGIYGVNVSKIQSATMNGNTASSASVNSATVQSIQHPITNVRQNTTASDYEEINSNQQTQRVVVLASDIETVSGRRKVTVSNATF